MKIIDTLLSPIRGRPPVVSVVRLDGIIKGNDRFSRSINLASVAGRLEAAFKMRHSQAVALLVNSPGGSPVQSDLIAGRIRALAKEHDKPVVAFVEDVAASGGYWLALAADEIFVTPASIIGSIGVISAGFGFQDAIERIGVERRVHTSGTRKSLLDPFQAENQDDVAYLEEIQSEIHAGFRKWVEERRGGKLKTELEPELFEGKFWTGARGVELGLADGIGDLRSVMRGRFGEKTRFRVLEERQGLLKRLGIGSSVRGSQGSMSGEIAAGLGEGMLETVESRALWARFGL